jgi:hypothetical protein
MNPRRGLLLLVVLCTAVAVTPVWAQSQVTEEETPAQQTGSRTADDPGPPLHVEVPDDPRIEVSPDAVQVTPQIRYLRGEHVAIQVNVDANGNNIVGDAGNEPSIAVDPTNPNRMVIGWRQFDTIASNFRQAGYGFTTDGGHTWTFDGRIIDEGVFRSDPVLAADTEGNFYYNSLTANDQQTEFSCQVFDSSDGGQTWGPAVQAYGGDKQWMVCDNTDSMGQNNLYANWNGVFSCCDGDFSVSYNQNQSWSNLLWLPGSPRWGTLAIGPDGELYINGDGFIVIKSSTIKDPFLPPAWDFNVSVNMGGSMVGWGGPNPGGLSGQGWIATDTSGGPNDGHVYMLSSVDPPGADPLDIHFVRSTDGGLTWSAPLRVNDDVSGNWQYFGTMSVAPNGRIDAVWNDTRGDPGGYMTETYYAYSEDGGLTWSANEPLTSPWDPHVGWPNQNKIGDYYDMVSDNDGANLAFATTLNGEQDVYFMRISRLMRVVVPGGAPPTIPPNTPTTIQVRVVEGSEEYIEDTATMYYRFDDGPFQAIPLTHVSGDTFEVTLPAAGCDDEPEYYFSAEGTVSGEVFAPPTAPTDVFTSDVGEFFVYFEDDFQTDTGWTVENSPGLADGAWERGLPAGFGDRGDPPTDYDGSGFCYLTDNVDGNSDVDDGTTYLISPVIDLDGLDADIRYALWYTNDFGGDPDNDYFRVHVTNNGVDWVLAQEFGPESTAGWNEESFLVSDFVTPTATVQVRFAASDEGAGSVVEAAVDAFRVDSFACLSEEIMIVGSTPPDGAIDARRPHEPDDAGIRYGWDAIELEFDGDVTGLLPADFMVTEDGGDGTPPNVMSVTPTGANTVMVTFDDMIEPLAWTTLAHVASGTDVMVGYLPGDANQDAFSSSFDTLSLIDHLNSIIDLPEPYATDIDRSGVSDSFDILELINLLNGADEYDVYNEASLP